MAVGDGIAFERAMGDLMTQVNPDNILAVQRVFEDGAKALRSELQQIDAGMHVGLCGGDPISKDAAGPASFGGKARQLLEPHWRHCEELEAVAERLKASARSYGFTEEEITSSMGRGPSR